MLVLIRVLSRSSLVVLQKKFMRSNQTPKCFDILKRTAGRNVVLSPLALSNAAGDMEFRVPRYGKHSYSNQGGTLSAIKVNEDYAAMPVKAARLDGLDLQNIGFIKIDVEGSESEVLQGAREVIARDRPTLMIEIEEKHTQVPIENALAEVLALDYDGFFFDRTTQALRSISCFEPEQHHRDPRKGYVFNFIFLPKSEERN